MTSCILSLIKDEHEYLEDFITHHINIGIDKIFLYEDITSSSHKDICAKYPQVILASARDLLGNETDQLKKSRIFHMECIIKGLLYIQQNYDFDWCFSIDADEFIQLDDSLEQYKDYEALIIPWVNYGYSGHILKPEHDKPIWEIFTQQCGFTKYDEQHGFITKVCYNMHKLKLHFIHGNHNALCNKVYPKDIHIDHYITKSFEEWLWKINVRGITAKDHRGIQDFFEMHQNLKYEDIIQQYNTLKRLSSS